MRESPMGWWAVPWDVRSRGQNVMFSGTPLCLCAREKGACFQKEGEEGQR